MITPKDFCDLHGACSEGRAFAFQFETMAEVWDNCSRIDWLAWMSDKRETLTKKQCVEIAIQCAESCMQFVLEGENRPKEAIDAAKAWLADQTEDNELRAKYAENALNVHLPKDRASYLARCAAWYAAYSVRPPHGGGYFAAMTCAASIHHATKIPLADAYVKMANLIRSIVGNPFLD